jgi:hypothetical protein
MGVFDQAAHYTAKLNPAGFFRWVLARFAARFEFRRWLDTTQLTFPGEPDRVCDTVAEFVHATDPGQRWIGDTEFQAEPDADMLERLGEYAYRLRRELRFGPGQAGKYRVVSVLLNLTGPAQPPELTMTEETLDDAGSRLKPVLWTLRAEDAAATLARIAGGELERCVLPWIPLMHGAEESAIIEEWKRLAEQEPDSRLRSEYAGLALVFAELADRTAPWKQVLRGWNVRQSQQVMEWQEEARVETRRADLLCALQLRFRTEVPADLVEAVNSLTDLNELQRWFAASQTADSLETFRAAVQP